MRILHIGRAPGGVGTHIETILEEAYGSGIEHIVLISDDDETLAATARGLGVEVFQASILREISPLADVRALRTAVRIVRGRGVDLIHGHSAKGGALGRLAGAMTRTPVVVTPNAFAYLPFHGFRRWVYLGFERALRPLTAALVACSASEASRAEDDVGFSADRVITIPNSLAFPDELPWAPRDTPPLVLMVGRLSYQKNPEQFVHACGLLRKRGVDAAFRLIGAGYLQTADLGALRGGADLDGAVEIVPWVAREDLLAVLSRATVLAMPSAFEGLPYIALEAMRLGVPIVGNRVDGIKDLIDDGVTGYLVPFGDEEAMADRVEDLLSSPVRAHGFAVEAYRKGLSEFEAGRNARRLVAVYSGLVPSAAKSST